MGNEEGQGGEVKEKKGIRENRDESSEAHITANKKVEKLDEQCGGVVQWSPHTPTPEQLQCNL